MISALVSCTSGQDGSVVRQRAVRRRRRRRVLRGRVLAGERDPPLALAAYLVSEVWAAAKEGDMMLVS